MQIIRLLFNTLDLKIAILAHILLANLYIQKSSASDTTNIAPTIMALGDSITNGSDGGYRKFLSNKLSQAGFSFDFVGSQHSGAFLDNEHEGHPSWSPQDLLNGRNTILDSMAGKLSTWITDYEPDIVLLHAGTNGLNNPNIDFDPKVSKWGFHVETMRLIINEIFKHNPSSYIILAQIIQRRDSPLGLISRFNTQLATMATSQENPRLVLVDMENILNFTPINYLDQFHPSHLGYSIMADTWLLALSPLLTTMLEEVKKTDSNGDGLSDFIATRIGLDPHDPDMDTDGDGIIDILEIGIDPNNPIDSDNDGLLDALEQDAASAIDASIASGLRDPTGGTITLTSEGGESLSRVELKAVTGGPIGVDFGFGSISYSTIPSFPGGSVRIKIAFSNNLPSNLGLFKVDSTNTYTLLPASIWTFIDPKKIIVTLTDGDRLTDLDGTVNGIIEDPIAFGEIINAADATHSPDGNNSSGCTLNPDATIDPVIIMILILFGYAHITKNHTLREF